MSDTNVVLALVAYNIKTTIISSITIFIDWGVIDYFFVNKIFFTLYENRYHEFKTKLRRMLIAFETGIIKFNVILIDKLINVITIINVD